MSEDARQVPVLLVESGDWLVGVDPYGVQAVEAHVLGEKSAVPLEALLSPQQPLSSSGTARFLVVSAGSDVQIVSVQRVVSCQLFDVGQMQPLPPVLHNFGAPSWCLGTMWLPDRLVLLVDLGAACGVRS